MSKSDMPTRKTSSVFNVLTIIFTKRQNVAMHNADRVYFWQSKIASLSGGGRSVLALLANLRSYFPSVLWSLRGTLWKNDVSVAKMSTTFQSCSVKNILWRRFESLHFVADISILSAFFSTFCNLTYCTPQNKSNE